MKVTLKETPEGFRELQWGSVNPLVWSAKSIDGEREYTVKQESDGITSWWSLAYRLDKTQPVEISPIRFFVKHEAQEVAQMFEDEQRVDNSKLKEIAAGNQVTVGGNAWKYYGIQNNLRLWICVLPGERTAYVATCPYGGNKWTVSKREWQPTGKGGMEKLHIVKLGEHRNLYRAQMSVTLLSGPSTLPLDGRNNKHYNSSREEI